MLKIVTRLREITKDDIERTLSVAKELIRTNPDMTALVAAILLTRPEKDVVETVPEQTTNEGDTNA